MDITLEVCLRATSRTVSDNHLIRSTFQFSFTIRREKRCSRYERGFKTKHLPETKWRLSSPQHSPPRFATPRAVEMNWTDRILPYIPNLNKANKPMPGLQPIIDIEAIIAARCHHPRINTRSRLTCWPHYRRRDRPPPSPLVKAYLSSMNAGIRVDCCRVRNDKSYDTPTAGTRSAVLTRRLFDRVMVRSHADIGQLWSIAPSYLTLCGICTF